MNHRRLNTGLFNLSIFSMQAALASHDAASSKNAQEAGCNPFEKLHAVEVKSIAKLLDQKDINQFLQSSRRCNADVRGESLTTFTAQRNDILTLKTAEQFNDFLKYGPDHLYALKLEVSIRSEEELRRLLEHPRLQSSLAELILRYVRPFDGEVQFEGNSVKINLVELLAPFKNLKSMRVVGAKSDAPSEAFTLLKNKNVEAFKALILREPKNLIIKNDWGNTLAHLAALKGELGSIQFLAELAPHILNEKDLMHRTPLHWAASQGNLLVVQFLVKYVPGAMKEKNRCGDTPAHLAANWETSETLSFLARHDPSTLNMKNKQGKTVLDIAIKNAASPALIAELETLAAAAARDQTPE